MNIYNDFTFKKSKKKIELKLIEYFKSSRGSKLMKQKCAIAEYKLIF
jgi:hypothetical protein